MTVSADHTARIWDPDTGDTLAVLVGHPSNVWSGDWSPRGGLVATCGQDNVPIVWDSLTGEVVYELENHDRWVKTVRWSPDGFQLLAADEDGQVVVFRPGLDETTYFSHVHESTIFGAAWSPDSKKVATTGAGITAKAVIWDVRSGDPIRVLEDHRGTVRSAAWLRDGSELVTIADDGFLRIWDAESGTLLQLLEGHSSRIRALAVSPSGDRLATASDDNSAVVWCDDRTGPCKAFELTAFDGDPGATSRDIETTNFDDERFDVALSFAGEDRPYVEEVAGVLREAGISVFYDKFEEVTLWGQDLYQRLAEVYSTARFTVVFISASYTERNWTRHELRFAQERELLTSAGNLLPARFDMTDVTGIPETLKYVDLKGVPPLEFAKLIVQKVESEDRD